VIDAEQDRGLCSYGADEQSVCNFVIAEMSKFINVPEISIARQQGCVTIYYLRGENLYICREVSSGRTPQIILKLQRLDLSCQKMQRR